jgi:hypothetical protein
MFRNNKNTLSTYPLLVLFNNGGMGDNLYRLRCCMYLADKWPHVDVMANVPDYLMDLAKYLARDSKLLPNIYSFTETCKGLPRACGVMQFDGVPHSYLHRHLFDHAINTIIDANISWDEVGWWHDDFASVDVSRFNLPATYIVGTPLFQSANRRMKEAEWNKLADALPMPIVHIGTETMSAGVKTDGKEIKRMLYLSGTHENSVNLINQTNLLEAARIMHGASAIIGVDNGLIHLASIPRTPTVAGYTNVNPLHRIPPTASKYPFSVVVPDQKKLTCTFCQSNMVYASHGFQNCLYQDNACVEEMTAEAFIEGLKKIGVI